MTGKKHYFLEVDFAELIKQINDVLEKIRLAGKEMGLSCQEGAETFHDNFAFEDSERNQAMWSRQLQDLNRISNNSTVITPTESTEKVFLGRTVTIEDDESGETQTVKIGSYMVLAQSEKDQGAISYEAPLAKIIIGAKEGESRKGLIAKIPRSFTIIEIK